MDESGGFLWDVCFCAKGTRVGTLGLALAVCTVLGSGGLGVRKWILWGGEKRVRKRMVKWNGDGRKGWVGLGLGLQGRWEWGVLFEREKWEKGGDGGEGG